MAEFQSITSTMEYSRALIALQQDVPNYIRATGLRVPVTVKIPKPLTELVFKRGEMAYESMKRGLKGSLTQFCEIGEWSRGQDENGENYITFKLMPGAPHANRV